MLQRARKIGFILSGYNGQPYQLLLVSVLVSVLLRQSPWDGSEWQGG